MMVLRFAFQSIRRNTESYLAFFFSTVIMVAMMFMSVSFENQPLLVKYLIEGKVPIDIPRNVNHLLLYFPLLLLFLFSSVGFFFFKLNRKKFA